MTYARLTLAIMVLAIAAWFGWSVYGMASRIQQQVEAAYGTR